MSSDNLPAKSAKAEKPDIKLSDHQLRCVKKIQSYHAACLKSFNQQMGYAFLVGLELSDLKESLPHGQFEAVREQCFPRIPERTLKRYHQFFNALLEFKPSGDKKAIVALLTDSKVVNPKGKLTKDGQSAVLAAVHEIADGKSLTEMYRDLGVIRKPKPDGGFRPNEEAVQAWLKEHHADLAGTKYADLPEKVQKEFKKQYRPKPVAPEMIAEAMRARGEASMDSLSEDMAENICMHWEKKFRMDYRRLLLDYVAKIDKIDKSAKEDK